MHGPYQIDLGKEAGILVQGMTQVTSGPARQRNYERDNTQHSEHPIKFS